VGSLIVERPKQFTNAGLARLGQVLREARQRIGKKVYGDPDLSQERFAQYINDQFGLNLMTKHTLSRLENGWLKTPQADTIQYLAPFTWNEEKQRPWLWYELIELAMDEIPTDNGNGKSRG
jgi:transcriptional regulator with XRE-family HTH domain